jgi:hypothetical protein
MMMMMMMMVVVVVQVMMMMMMMMMMMTILPFPLLSPVRYDAFVVSWGVFASLLSAGGFHSLVVVMVRFIEDSPKIHSRFRFLPEDSLRFEWGMMPSW